ncbi:MAG: ABC transporter permease [Gemmataceae bacterium]
MSYTLTTLWQERARYWPGVLAVAFSAVLIALQCGLLLGLFSITSIPIDEASADVWVGDPAIQSVDVGRPIPDAWLARVASLPEIQRVETYLEGFTYWAKPSGGTELVCVIGARLDGDSLGAVDQLTPELRVRLTEPGAVIVDERELDRLGVRGVGDTAEIGGRRVRIVGLIHGVPSLVGPYVFCSISTARPLLRGYLSNQTTYLLAKTRPGVDRAAVVARLSDYQDMSTFTNDEFSMRTRLHWLTRTKAGLAMGCAAALGLLVGAVVTSQTLFAAVKASRRELAVLRALGIPYQQLVRSVLSQSLWVGLIGVVLALPTAYALSVVATALGAKVLLPGWLMAVAAILTLGMALFAGMTALRSLRQAEPAALLR